MRIEIGREKKNKEDYEDKKIYEIENKIRDVRNDFDSEKRIR